MVMVLVFWLSVFDYRWYRQEFAARNVYQSLSRERVLAQADNLFASLKGRAELDGEYYTVRELAHLQDIKFLLSATKVISIGLALFFGLVFAWFWQQGIKPFLRNIFFGGIFSLIVYSGIALAGNLFFNSIFIRLHRLLFKNDFWQLDPATEKLIVIFPPELFAALGFKIILTSAAVSLVLTTVSGIWLWRTKNF